MDLEIQTYVYELSTWPQHRFCLAWDQITVSGMYEMFIIIIQIYFSNNWTLFTKSIENIYLNKEKDKSGSEYVYLFISFTW